MTKYVQRRTKTDGSVVWAFNPPAYVRETITDCEISYVQFEDRIDAEEHSKQVSEMYFDAKRAEAKNVYLPIGSVMSLVAAVQTHQRMVITVGKHQAHLQSATARLV